MGQDRSIARAVRDVDRVESLAECSDLIDLDEDRIGASLGDASLQKFWICHEQVIAHDLNFRSERRCERLPSCPIALGESIFDRTNRPLRAPGLPESNHFVAREDALGITLEEAVALLAARPRFLGEFARGGIEADENLATEVVACNFDGARDEIKRFFVALEIRCEAALVADRC